MVSGKRIVLRMLGYWRQLLMVTIPFMLLPLLLFEDVQKGRCAYVVSLVCLYWIVEPIPLGATCLIPIVLFPILGVLTTEKACQLYMNDTNMMFVGTLIMAIAIEHSHLHQRIALKVLCLLGTSIKRVVFGLTFISMFLSIWINNVAITAMMMPVVDSLANELLQERQRTLSGGNIDVEGIIALRELAEKKAASTANGQTNSIAHIEGDKEEPDVVAPTKVISEQPVLDKITEHRIRAILYLSVLYGTNIGTITTITSGASNVVFQFVVEDLYGGRAPVDYALWLFFALPIALIGTGLTFVAVVPFFFRCKSPDLGKERSSYVMEAIHHNYAALGPLRFHEVAVLLLFILLVFLWLFRDPMFAKGWATYFDPIRPKDATAVMIPVILLFMIPSKPWEGPKSPALMSWPIVQARLHWSVILLIGSSFAIAEGDEAYLRCQHNNSVLRHRNGITSFIYSLLFGLLTWVSGLSQLVGQELTSLGHLSPVPLMICLSIVSTIFSEFISNAAACVILLPVFASLAEDLGVSPLLLMIPTTIASNYAFLLPVGTPANAMVYEHGRLTLMEMVLPGALAKIICMAVTIVATCVIGDPIFGMFQKANWTSAAMKEDLNATVMANLR